MNADSFGMYTLMTTNDSESDWMASLSDENLSTEHKPNFNEFAAAIQALPNDVVTTQDMALTFHGDPTGGIKSHKYNRSDLDSDSDSDSDWTGSDTEKGRAKRPRSLRTFPDAINTPDVRPTDYNRHHHVHVVITTVGHQRT